MIEKYKKREIQKNGFLIKLWHDNKSIFRYGTILIPEGCEKHKPGKHLIFSYKEDNEDIQIKFSSVTI